MSAVSLDLSPLEARRFARRVLLLDHAVPGVAVVLGHLGYVQIDPVNVCGRMHDLILRNRVVAYREGDLTRHLHGDERTLAAEQRSAFEHHLPGAGILVAFPTAAWPYLHVAMRGWAAGTSAWSGRLTPRERELGERILGELKERGALSSEDIDDERRGRSVWGRPRLAKSTLQKLFFHGRVLISGRRNNRRYYDLPERVIPPDVYARRAATPEESRRWLVLTKLQQRRLTTLKRDEVPLVEDVVRAVRVEGCPPLYCLRADEPVIEEARSVEPPATVRLLAPLDPLIYERRVTRTVWDFDYTWEVYTPAHKRVRGHYALPVLAGTELVGHVDPKAHRTAGRLQVVSRSIRRGHKTAPAVTALARFLGLR